MPLHLAFRLPERSQKSFSSPSTPISSPAQSLAGSGRRCQSFFFLASLILMSGSLGVPLVLFGAQKAPFCSLQRPSGPCSCPQDLLLFLGEGQDLDSSHLCWVTCSVALNTAGEV